MPGIVPLVRGGNSYIASAAATTTANIVPTRPSVWAGDIQYQVQEASRQFMPGPTASRRPSEGHALDASAISTPGTLFAGMLGKLNDDLHQYGQMVIGDGAGFYAPMTEPNSAGHYWDVVGNHDAAIDGFVNPALTQVPGPHLDEALSTDFGIDGDIEWNTPPANLQIGDGPFAIEVWVLRDAAGLATLNGIIDFGSGGGGNGPILFWRVDNTIGFEDNAFTNGDFTNSSKVMSDTTIWHHIVANKSGATRELWVDAVQVPASAHNTTLTSVTGQVKISSTGTTAAVFRGFGFAVYNGLMLTSTQIATHYKLGNQLFKNDQMKSLMGR